MENRSNGKKKNQQEIINEFQTPDNYHIICKLNYFPMNPDTYQFAIGIKLKACMFYSFAVEVVGHGEIVGDGVWVGRADTLPTGIKPQAMKQHSSSSSGGMGGFWNKTGFFRGNKVRDKGCLNLKIWKVIHYFLLYFLYIILQKWMTNLKQDGRIT